MLYHIQVHTIHKYLGISQCLRQEEEDLQQWMEGVIPGPWSDQGWTSHVVHAVGGELETWRKIIGE